MGIELKVFLDTSALFAAVYSETGGARLLLKLGEAEAIELWAGPWVLRETDAVLDRKSPGSKPYFAVLLDRARMRVGTEAVQEALDQALSAVDYQPDAQVVAEALTIHADYFVTFDRKHLIENPQTAALPFPIGIPGDFLAWYRNRITIPPEGPA